MSEKPQGTVTFHIDSAFTSADTRDATLNEYELSFQDFLEKTAHEGAEKAFSYTNKSIKKAGRRLRKKEGDLKSATALIQQFRAAHEKPLSTIAYLVGRCCRESKIDVKIVTRLKRLETIIDKLQRHSLDGKTENATCVTNMNDIGGCRAVFPDIESLRAVESSLKITLQKVGRIKIKDIDDYVSNFKPNDCGYRSLHVIYRYEHISQKSFNIEVQLRTQLQHLWATTVEIVDILEETKIKTHSHSQSGFKLPPQPQWEEVFSIMSRYIADAEGVIKLVSSDKASLSQRLNQLNDEIDMLSRLRSFKVLSEKVHSCCDGGTEHVLLVINENNQDLIFNKEFKDHGEAILAYNFAEKITQNYTRLNTLLISTKNMEQLSQAYPNYLGDCSDFITLLEKAMRDGVIL